MVDCAPNSSSRFNSSIRYHDIASMSVGFGFSAGDFIAAIKLVAPVIDALSESSKSSFELRELLGQLYSLETALLGVKSLEIDESLHAEQVALRQTAAQCQRTITSFLHWISGYQRPLLRNDGTIGERWKKIKWAVCRKKDLEQFKMDLMAHTESIQLLLMLLQFKNSNSNHVHQQANQRSMVSLVQDGFSGCMQRISGISGVLTTVASHTQECVEGIRRIITINAQVFHIVLNLQNLLRPSQDKSSASSQSTSTMPCVGTARSISSSSNPQKPSSVFSATISKRHGYTSRQIQDGQIIIHDAVSTRYIDLTLPWEECFMPGQRVEM
ncbi:MAG: hypothetical protein Q9183_005792, partial [Haloplaca sp. 2 TL-2023]